MNTVEGITIVQSISTRWSKKSRGAPGSIIRNAIPETLRLPLEKCPKGRYALIEHHSSFYEYRDFVDPHPSISFEPFEPGETTRYGCVVVQRNDNRLRVSWNYTSEDAGMPLRPTKKNDEIEVFLNEWGRVIYNGRFSEESGWWYEKTVLNIGLFERPNALIFVETKPDVEMDKRARLY